MGDERGIRLRCIALGRAFLRGSRMRGMARAAKARNLGLPDPLSRSHRCLQRSRFAHPPYTKVPAALSELFQALLASSIFRQAHRALRLAKLCTMAGDAVHYDVPSGVGFTKSQTATFLPSLAAALEHARPPEPPPITCAQRTGCAEHADGWPDQAAGSAPAAAEGSRQGSLRIAQARQRTSRS